LLTTPDVVEVHLDEARVEVVDPGIADRREDAPRLGSDAKNAVFTNGECATA